MEPEGLIPRIPLIEVDEARGTLSSVEFDNLPFVPRRVFFVSNVPPGTVRGGHAHRTAVQLMLCVAGEIEVLLRHREDEETLTLRPGDDAVLIPPGTWSSQTYRTANATLLVLSSESYAENSYVT